MWCCGELRGLGARVRTYVGEGSGARVRTYVCEGWVGAYPHPTPYPPTPLYPLYCKGVIYPPTPLVGKVRTTCNTIPQTMVRYACVTTARAVNQAPASHRCPRMPQLPGQAPASPGKPRQAPASPVKPQESEARSARCLLRLEKIPSCTGKAIRGPSTDRTGTGTGTRVHGG